MSKNPVLESHAQLKQAESIVYLARTVTLYYKALTDMGHRTENALTLAVAYQNMLVTLGAQYAILKGQ